jgi:hypothetical protein
VLPFVALVVVSEIDDRRPKKSKNTEETIAHI